MNLSPIYVALSWAALLGAAAQPAPPVYHGARREIQVDLPRVESAPMELDGRLSEPEWEQAAVLTGFTQFEPAEGAAASEHTEVLVFYTPQALYVAVRARAQDPSRIRATLADRDNIARDDHIQITLDTFLDRRRAYVFSVNPLGVQQDGVYSEGGGRRRGDQIDLSPDFLFHSRGRLTPEGYAVEVRIPLKSLKFPSASTLSWGLNVTRHIAATGATESWAPLSRSNPQLLAQSGTLQGLRDLRPGRLVELNPVATGKREGATHEGAFGRGGFEPDLGMNLRVGLTSNLTLDATVNPDFSQVEADAGQIATNERFALFFPEKRPFFLEGADIFATMEPLVYTRSIVDPIAGTKLTGKVGALSVGYLGALDESPLDRTTFTYAPEPERALFQVVRLQRDVGAGSSLGAVFTDREAGSEFNRVAAVDGRLRFRSVYSLQFQAAGSWTRAWAPEAGAADSVLLGGSPVAVAPADRTGHLLAGALDRTGRSWGFRAQVKDVPDGFRAHSGFVRRTGMSELSLVNRFSFFGAQGAVLESVTPFLMATRIYDGRSLWEGGDAAEGSAALRTSVSLRGNNRVVVGLSRRFFVLDPARYARYRLEDGTTGAELVAPGRDLEGLGGVSVDASSSYFKTVSAELDARWEQTAIFAEGTPGEEWSVRAGLRLRPTSSLRLEADARSSRIYRQSDGSLYSRATIPRLKAEYQLTRALFLRAVGQYSLEEVDLLRSPGGAPYVLADGSAFRVLRGRVLPEALGVTHPVRIDLLLSYEPSPGTVVFLGYGREMTDDGAFRFSPLEPRADGLFVKVSYLFRS